VLCFGNETTLYTARALEEEGMFSAYSRTTSYGYSVMAVVLEREREREGERREGWQRVE